MTWKTLLKDDQTQWLLNPENPCIRYWALQDLEGYPSDNPKVVKAHEMVMEAPEVKAILATQHPEGFWVHDEDMYLPKYKATTHQLLILAELGAKKTLAIEKALEKIFNFQRTSGHFLTNIPKTLKGRSSVIKDGCCLDGNILFYMVHFGYLEDLRIRHLIDFTVDYYDDDNAGWRCRAYPINPDGVFPKNCYMGATKVLKAFSIIPEDKRTAEIKSMIKREVENVLENYIYKYLRNSDGSRKDKAGWKRFGFPLFYQSDALEVLDTLTRLCVRDGRMESALELVKEAQRNDGKWLLKNTFNGKMWVDIEEKNKPSKWITLRAMRVLKRFYGG